MAAPTNNNPFIAPVPVDPSDWFGLRRVITDLKAHVQNIVGNPVVPDVPAGLRLTSVDSGGVQLTWGSVPGAAGYYVYRSQNSHLFSSASVVASLARAHNTSFYHSS